MNNEFIKIFWVGLMDGDGSIQVNHWKKKGLQFRLVIKLKYNLFNEKMLKKIAESIGGEVKPVFKKGNLEEIIWIVNSKKTISKMISIFNKYPPLTSKKLCQLSFLKNCLLLEKNDIEKYFVLREKKYERQFEIINAMEKHVIPNYFDVWLSGFTEAEGCFSLRINNNHSFSIGQNDDRYILVWIKEKFGVINKIRLTKEKFYSIEVYRKTCLLDIIKHFSIDFPLLGDKIESLNKFMNKIVN